MKIGFLINDLSQGGAERATVSLANCFEAHSHHSVIITFKKCESFYSVDDGVEIISADFEEIEHSASLRRLTDSVKRMVSLRRFIKKQKLDVLIGMSFSMTYYAVFATKFSKTKSVGTERSNPYVYKATRLNTILRRLFYRLAGGYVFQTQKAAGFFEKKKLSKGVVIRNAIFNQKIYELEPPEKRDNIIYSAGRLSAEKRYDLLIRAFADIADRFPEHSLVIFGEGKEREKLERIIDETGMAGRVSLPGADENAVIKINSGCLFVLSSDFEGMPNALMEALAMGVPSISTRCDMGPEELIEDGVSGILTEVGSEKQLADAMAKVLGDEELAQRLSLNGRKLLKESSIDEIGRQWLEYLRSV